jgi:competence ComEA-like helix-hairpin-helix protein
VDALTPAERRGAIVVVLLLALGTAHDLWRASRPLPASPADRRGVGATSMEPWSGDPGRGDGGDGAGDPRDGHRAAGASGTERVDLNRATAADLDALPGVGPVLAGRIIAHRERHGPFRDTEELLAVRGIGPRLFTRIRPRITVGGRPPEVPVPAPTGPDTVARTP